MAEQTANFYEFGRFRLKSDERVLLRGDELVPLTPKAFDILLTLLENDGRIVHKDDLMRKVWPNTFVEEGNLTQNVSLLRKALGESANGPQFIETVPRRGYRFVAQVNRSRESDLCRLIESTAGTPRNGQLAQTTLETAPSTLNVGLSTFFSRHLPAVAVAISIVVIAVSGIAYLSARNNAGASSGSIQ